MKTTTSALLALAMTAAFASTALAGEASCTNVPKSKWMSADAIKAKAASMGYDVRSIRREGSCYEAKALINGKRREIVFNPANGELVDGNELN
jgi:hypothetical protein